MPVNATPAAAPPPKPDAKPPPSPLARVKKVALERLAQEGWMTELPRFNPTVLSAPDRAAPLPPPLGR